MTKHNLTQFAAGLIATLAITLPAFGATPAPATTQAVSNTRWATRTVRYPLGDYDPSNDDAYDILNQTIRVLAPKMLGVNGSDVVGSGIGARPWINILPIVTADRADVMMTLTIPKGAAPPIAGEFLDAVVAKSQEQVKQLYAQARAKPLKDATRAAAESQQRFHQAADELASIRKNLRAAAGRVDVSPQGIADAVSKLEEEKQKIELDTMGKQARRDAIEKQVSEQSDKIQEQIKDDAIAAQLQKVVDAREKKAKFVAQQVSAGIATPGEADEANANLAEATAKLLQRRHDAAVEAGGDALAALNRESLNLSVDLSEAKARLKFIDGRLSHLASVTDDMDPLERARTQEQSAAAELDARTKALHDLQTRIASLPPGELTVISSENRATPPGNGS